VLIGGFVFVGSRVSDQRDVGVGWEQPGPSDHVAAAGQARKSRDGNSQLRRRCLFTAARIPEDLGRPEIGALRWVRVLPRFRELGVPGFWPEPGPRCSSRAIRDRRDHEPGSPAWIAVATVHAR